MTHKRVRVCKAEKWQKNNFASHILVEDVPKIKLCDLLAIKMI